MPETLSLAQKNFVGGMAPDIGDFQVDDNQTEFLVNVSLGSRVGTIEQAKGNIFYSSVQGAPDQTLIQTKSIFRFYQSLGITQTIVSWQKGGVAGISIVDAASETLISDAINKPVTDYAVHANKLFMVNGTSKLYIWDGFTLSNVTFPILGTAPFAPKFIEMHKKRAYYAGDEPLPSTLVWSENSEPSLFDTFNFVNISDDDGDQIRGIASEGANLVVFKERKPFVIEGSPPQRINALPVVNMGCIDQKTIQKTDSGIVYLSHSGVIRLGARGVEILSRVVEQLLKALVKTAQNTFSSAYHNNVYYLFYRPFSQAIITEGLSFDLSIEDPEKNIVPISKLINFNLQDSAVFRGAIDSQEWFGCMSGTNNIIRMDAPSPTYYKDQSSPAEPLTAFVVSKWLDMGNSSLEKDLRTIYVYFHKTIQSMKVTLFIEHFDQQIVKELDPITEEVSQWNDALWDVALWGGKHVFTHAITLPAGCLCHRVKLTFSAEGAGDQLNLDGFEIKYLLLPEVQK